MLKHHKGPVFSIPRCVDCGRSIPPDLVVRDWGADGVVCVDCYSSDSPFAPLKPIPPDPPTWIDRHPRVVFVGVVVYVLSSLGVGFVALWRLAEFHSN